MVIENCCLSAESREKREREISAWMSATSGKERGLMWVRKWFAPLPGCRRRGSGKKGSRNDHDDDHVRLFKNLHSCVCFHESWLFSRIRLFGCGRIFYLLTPVYDDSIVNETNYRVKIVTFIWLSRNARVTVSFNFLRNFFPLSNN